MVSLQPCILSDPAECNRFVDFAVGEFVSSKPGRVALRRLNRREYGYAIRDLLGLDIDATAWLPEPKGAAESSRWARSQMRRASSLVRGWGDFAPDTHSI